jgi:glutathione S-transferase
LDFPEVIVIVYSPNSRCKICTSSLREEIDLMLIGETLLEDGTRFEYVEIMRWASDKGLQISAGGLSRHRTNHLNPAVQATLETQRMIEAVSAATGKKLSIHTAIANAIAAKALRLLNDKEADFDAMQLEKLLNLALRAGEVAGKLERTENAVKAEVMDAASEKMKAGGISADVIKEIEEQILGMRR